MISYHQSGTQVIDRKNRRLLLLRYLGEYVAKDGTIRFKLDTPFEGKDYVKFEVWETINCDTGMRDIKNIPVYIYGDTIESLDSDRPHVINDNNEVTSLLDGYSCWEEYCKNNESIRDGKNFHLDIINSRHQDQIFKLRKLEAEVKEINFKKGVRLKLIQKENPDHYVRKEFLKWKQEFPQLFTKLIDYVYKNADISSVTN